MLAYAVGLLPSTLGDRLSGLSPVLLIACAAAVGSAIMLASIGAAQWAVLHRVSLGRIWWIATAGAWLVALLIFMAIATPLWQLGQPLWLTVLIGAIAGAAMAFTAAGLTGLAAARLVHSNSTAP